MAGGAPLNARAGVRLVVLAAVVLLLHTFALQWLARQLEPLSVLRSLPTPMFTRVLQQEIPVAPTPAAEVAAAEPRKPAITSIDKPRARPPKRAASEPVPEPEIRTAEVPAPAQVAPVPAPVAETPAPSASAPPPIPAAESNPAVASTDSWPADTRLNYRLGGQFRSGELHGSARVQWQREGDRYQTRIDIDVTLLASLVLTSQGEVTPRGLVPRAYEELRRSGPRGARLGDTAITLADGRTVPRPPGVQDTASQFVELTHRFATGQDVLEVGRSVSFWMARPGGVDLWTYDIVATEWLQAPGLGAIQAFHLKPRPIANPRGNITAEMWFAPSLQYLPVRIRVNMGEATFVDLIVEKIEQR